MIPDGFGFTNPLQESPPFLKLNLEQFTDLFSSLLKQAVEGSEKIRRGKPLEGKPLEEQREILDMYSSAMACSMWAALLGIDGDKLL